MKRLIIVLLTIVLLTGCASPQFRVIDGMVIQGPEQFYNDITEGLDLLKDKAPDYHALILDNVRKVWLDEKGDYNGVYDDYSYGMAGKAYEEYRAVGENIAYVMAIVLTHEAVHAQRLRQDVDTGNAEVEEWFAVETEKVVMKLIEAPDNVRNWLSKKRGFPTDK